MNVILYKTADGVAVIHPTAEALTTYSVQEIATKDVPSGLPFKIVDVTDLPDRNFRGAWDIDVALLNDGVGA